MRKLFVILAASALVLAFTLPAMAQAEWSFYGSSRMWMEWQDYDENAPSNPGLAGFDDQELVWTLQSNSRIGANVSAGDITGHFEYGTGVNLRLLYGAWNFGPGTILGGQDYTPIFYGVSAQCGLGGGDCGFIGWGTYYTGRRPQVKLSMGGFQVALLDPTPLTQPLTVVPADTDETLPEIEVAYNFSFGPGAFHIGGAYHTHDVVRVAAGAEREYSVDSWAILGGWKLGFGPLYFNGSVWYGQNPGDNGIAFAPGMLVTSAFYNAGTDSIEDTDAFSGQLILGFVVSDMLKFEGGYNYYDGELDIAGATTEQQVSAYYIQAAISPVKNVFLIPEIGVVDYGDLEVTGLPDIDLGDATYFGMKFQINF